MKVRYVTVRISRHAGVEIVKSVPAWEVRVLNTIFGEAEVTQEGMEEVDLVDDHGKAISFDPKAQFETLLRRYGTATDSEGDKMIYKAYRDAHELGDAVRRMQQSWETESPPPPKKRGRPALDVPVVIP